MSRTLQRQNDIFPDCGNPTEAGYLYDTPSATTEGGTVAVTGCDTGNGYVGTPSPNTLTCADGSWTEVTGCLKGMNDINWL